MPEQLSLVEFGRRFYQGISELTERLLKDVLAKDAGPPNTTERDAKLAILYFFSKAYKTFQAIYELWSRGFDQDAIILNRTLLEILLQADWIHHDPENAKRFQDHAAASSYAVYELMIKLSDATFPEAGEMASALAADPHFADKRSRYDEFTVKYGKVPMNWWGDNLRELVKKLCATGKDAKFYSEEYFYSYRTESGLVHSTALWVEDYVEKRDDGLQLHFLPERPKDASVIVHASRRVLRMNAIVNAVWNLSFAKEIDDGIHVIEDGLKAIDEKPRS
jgi:hypothetical protein